MVRGVLMALGWPGLLAGCGQALPTLPAGGEHPCAGIGLIDATLRGNASDSRVAWVQSGTHRIDVVWPHGYHARFNPFLEILNADGEVVLRQGETVDGGCVLSPDDEFPLLLQPPFHRGQ